MVPETKTKGTSGANSRTRASAAIPSKPGMEKSERMTSGAKSCSAWTKVSSVSTTSDVTRRPARLSSRTSSSASAATSSVSRTRTVRGLAALASSRIAALPRQGEVEARALLRPRLGPYPAAVAQDHALHDREADAGSGDLILGMQALEHAEELRGVAHVEADAVVAHPVDVLGALRLAADLDPSRIALAAVLEGVADEVQPHLLQQRVVGQRRRQLADGEARRGVLARELGRGRLRGAGHVDFVARGLLLPEAREGDKVVNQLAHPAPAQANPAT